MWDMVFSQNPHSGEMLIGNLMMLSGSGQYNVNDTIIIERRAIGGMRTGGGNQRTPIPVLLCPSQIPHDITWDQTRAAVMGSQQLTT
jgi:hypothetical protein